jgi:hypothetical protein
MDCRAGITDVAYVHCEVRSVSDVTPPLHGERHGNSSITGMKAKFWAIEGHGEEKNHVVFLEA